MARPMTTKPIPTNRSEVPDENAASDQHEREELHPEPQDDRQRWRARWPGGAARGRRCRPRPGPAPRPGRRAGRPGRRSRPRTRNGAPITGCRPCGGSRRRAGRRRGPRRRPATGGAPTAQPGSRMLAMAIEPKTTSRTPKKRPSCRRDGRRAARSPRGVAAHAGFGVAQAAFGADHAVPGSLASAGACAGSPANADVSAVDSDPGSAVPAAGAGGVPHAGPAGRAQAGRRARRRLERDDEGQDDVEQDREAAEEDRQDPQDPDDGRVDLEVLGHAGGDAGQLPIVTAAVETTRVHLQPPIGFTSTLPTLAEMVTSAWWFAIE